MPPYGAKTGVTTLIALVKHICRIFLVFEPKIVAWMGTISNPTDRALAIAWIATTKAVCSILQATPDD